MRVYAKSPAVQAGIRGGQQRVRVGNTILWIGGDLIVRVDGQKVESSNGLSAYLEDHKRVGETIELGILRDGRQVKVRVELGELPQQQRL